MSRMVLALKVKQLRRLKATRLVTTNPGCQMQLQAGLQAAGIPMEVCHLSEVLDRAYRRDPAYRQAFNLSD
jgi:glycolate oxidase iron-sulfur subunit